MEWSQTFRQTGREITQRMPPVAARSSCLFALAFLASAALLALAALALLALLASAATAATLLLATASFLATAAAAAASATLLAALLATHAWAVAFRGRAFLEFLLVLDDVDALALVGAFLGFQSSR